MPPNRRQTPDSTDDGLIDDTNRRLIAELQADARLTLAELGRRVALSSPAVAERLRRLEEAGVITGYRADGRSARARLRASASSSASGRRRASSRIVADLARSHARGRRVPPRDRRRLLHHDRLRPRRGAPRGGHRPLRRATARPPVRSCSRRPCRAVRSSRRARTRFHNLQIGKTDFRFFRVARRKCANYREPVVTGSGGRSR